MQVKIPATLIPIFQGAARYRAAYGGRGSGKSVTFAKMLLLRGLEKRRKLLCGREFQNSIKDSVHAELEKQIYEMGLGDFYTVQDKTIIGANGTTIIYRGFWNNLNSLRSLTDVDICWVEEAESLSERSWQVLVPTIRNPNSELWFTFNPEREDSPTKQRLIDTQADNIKIVKINWQQNPWFPAVLNEERLTLQKRDPDAYQHVWEGFCSTRSDAQVFRGKWHVEDFTPGDHWHGPYFGADFGFAVDPSVLVKCWVHNQCLYIEYEAYGVRTEMEDMPHLYDTIPDARKYTIYGDCARPETISYIHRQDFEIVACEKWTGSVEDGIEFIRGSFDKVIIHTRCPHTANEFMLYSHKIDKLTDEIMPDVVDKHNHCIAQGELVTTIKGLVPIEDIRCGDMVMTRIGWKKVLKAWKVSDNREIWEIKAGNHTLRATPDHEIFTLKNDYTRMDTISYDDDLLSYEDSSCQKPRLGKSSRKKLDSWEGFIDAIPTQKIGQIGSITKEHQENGCIGTYGNPTTGRKSPKVSISTILTRIHAIIHLRTWSASLHGNILPNIRQRKNGLKDDQTISMKSGRLPLVGTDQKQDWPGIVKMAKNAARTLFPLKRIAHSVVGSFLPTIVATVTNFALIRANRLIDAEQAQTMKKDVVLNATESSRPTNIRKQDFVPVRVRKITALKTKSAVYDLTVEDAHEFVVSGLLVHNCIDSVRYAIGPLIKRRDSLFDL